MTTRTPWHEDDSFWEDWGPVMFPRRIWEGTPLEVDGIISLLGISPGMHILDLGCGPGRHSLELARRGFRVTGVDRTRVYLDEASQRAAVAGLDIEFVHEDMRSFYREGVFDAAINMLTSFSYFEDPEEDRQVVANVYRSLKPGGVFLLETNGKEVLARIFQERSWDEEDGILWLQERRVSQNWGWMENRWIMIKGDTRIEGNISHRLYAATEMTA
ncbi:MAG: class I SAM-dependent methyltransferase, partial [Chloroflexota bacterium]